MPKGVHTVDLDSRLSVCFVAIRRSLLQEETYVAYAIIGELNGSGRLAELGVCYEIQPLER
ncbi:MAG: hypothetical protein OXI67_07030 [Candidatus Poribacteria bacterium]|nr:hypothetical protein [Candidatus Poribacteria bacterium]